MSVAMDIVIPLVKILQIVLRTAEAVLLVFVAMAIATQVVKIIITAPRIAPHLAKMNAPIRVKFREDVILMIFKKESVATGTTTPALNGLLGN